MTLSLFEGYGIEIELVVVDRELLDVRPLADEVLRRAAGSDAWVEDFDDGPIGWSNELVTHVIELKTNGPVPRLDGVAADFRASAARMRAILEPLGARLMPSGMHPLMDPARETRLWDHQNGEVYAEYDRLFDCRRHGWANLQSVHLNLPFAGDAEFARLMAAVRVVLPLIPGLAASSPLVEGRVSGVLDNRLAFYRTNSSRVPSMTGAVVPEPVLEPARYREEVFAAIDRDLRAAGAAEALLGNEWTNARGAIARFDRDAIEVRLLDAQEHAAADLALCAAVSGLVRALVEERWGSFEAQAARPTEGLARLLEDAVARGPAAELGDDGYAGLFGLEAGDASTVGAVWRALVPSIVAGPVELEEPLRVVLEEGTLAERILRGVGPAPEAAAIRAVYGELCACLDEGRSFRP